MCSVDQGPSEVASQSSDGFTLVELVVVSVLLALMSAILYGTLTSIMGGRQVIESQREATGIALVVLDSLTRDLNSRALIPLRTSSGSSTSSSGVDGSTGASGTSASGSGLDGSGAASGLGFFAGENQKEGEADSDVLRFIANDLPGDSPGVPPNYGLVEVTYRLVEVDRTTVPEDIPTDNSVYRLVREEVPAAIQDEELIKSRTQVRVVADRVAGFNVRYLRNGTWEKVWKSSVSTVPEAVEVTLLMFANGGAVERYRTAVAVSKRPKQR